MKFSHLIEVNDRFIPVEKSNIVKKLPPGVYNPIFDREAKSIYFDKIKFMHDEILDIPSKEYQLIIKQIEYFLKPETRDKFDKYGFLYKRSALLYGEPGTGKTCIANRVAQHVIDLGGVIFFNPAPSALPLFFKAIDDVQPETPVAVIMEELDQLVKENEGSLLNLLDGELQKENVIFLSTTNFIEQIPDRIRRPGRFSNVIEIVEPTSKAREYYLKHKLTKGDHKEITNWVEKTEGLSIDQLKETVLATKCLGESLNDIIKRIRKAGGINSKKKLEED